MVASKVPAGHVRALVELPNHEALAAAAMDRFRGQHPARSMSRYARHEGEAWDGERKIPGRLEIDPEFGAIPIGGIEFRRAEGLRDALREPEKSDRFLVSGFVEASRGVPHYFTGNDGQRYPVYSNPAIGGLLSPCLPTCGTSQYVGTAQDVRHRLDVQTLKSKGLDGSGVGLAIVDSGIYVPRLEQLLGEALQPKATLALDPAHSWKPPGLVTRPGQHRVGHGTMCAYDALIAAPKATLLDLPMLLARPVGDHHSASMVDAAILAYVHVANIWWGVKPFDALVVSNSWGLFHPCLEDFPAGHPYRFIDNPNHVFHHFVHALAASGVDIVFCGNNCGDGANCAGNCASGTCLSKTHRMIMGASTYEEVLTVGGCDTNDAMVGYSSRGPSIAGMYQNKPDLVAYTHFLGSKAVRAFLPDTGVSAACPLAAGCVAALRSKVKPTTTKPKDLFTTLRNTARRPGGGPAGWKPDFGHGIIDPVAAAAALGIP
jgi:hypothetical protein